jgi:hypothetical protein
MRNTGISVAGWVIAAYVLVLGLFEILVGLELPTLGHARLGTA